MDITAALAIRESLILITEGDPFQYPRFTVMTTASPALQRPVRPAPPRVEVYGYRFEFGPYRWAYSREVLLWDLVGAVEDGAPLEPATPIEKIDLTQLPDNSLYVGKYI